MNKLFIKVMSLTMLLITSCSQNVDVLIGDGIIGECRPSYIIPGTKNAKGENAITFSNYSDARQAFTRASVNSLSNTNYDDFTLFTWTNDSVVMNGFHVTYVDGNPSGWAYFNVDNQPIKYFDNFVDKYNFLGVIPMTDVQMSESDNLVKVNVEGFTVDNETTTDTPKEFLYAVTTVAKAEYEKGATINFKHGNAKVYLKFTSNDPNTEIIDYYPNTSGYHVYEINTKPTPVIGPLLSEIEITDEDIEYINNRYASSLGWISYYSKNTVIDGDLNNSMSVYLNGKYDNVKLASGQGNWAQYLQNPNMRLVHIEKTGHTSQDNDSYRGWFVNVQNVTLVDKGESGSQGKEGIIMLPATSINGDGSDAVLATYPQTAEATLSINGLSWSEITTSNSVTYSLPTTKITSNNTNSPIASPTTWYNLPFNTNNVGYTVKISYMYKGIAVYDARIWLPASECQWEGGKYYTYIIQINGRGNGKQDPNNIEGDDPIVENNPSKQEIKVFKVEFTDYEDTEPIIKEIK